MREWRSVGNYLRSFRDFLRHDPIVIGDHEFWSISGDEKWIRMPAGLANYNQKKQLFEVCKHLGLFCALVKDDATESADSIIIVSCLYEDF